MDPLCAAIAGQGHAIRKIASMRWTGAALVRARLERVAEDAAQKMDSIVARTTMRPDCGFQSKVITQSTAK